MHLQEHDPAIGAEAGGGEGMIVTDNFASKGEGPSNGLQADPGLGKCVDEFQLYQVAKSQFHLAPDPRKLRLPKWLRSQIFAFVSKCVAEEPTPDAVRWNLDQLLCLGSGIEPMPISDAPCSAEYSNLTTPRFLEICTPPGSGCQRLFGRAFAVAAFAALNPTDGRYPLRCLVRPCSPRTRFRRSFGPGAESAIKAAIRLRGALPWPRSSSANSTPL